MANKYLDLTGLAYFWSKVKDYVDVHSGSPTVTSGDITATAGTINYYRCGHIVTVTVTWNNSSSSGAWLNMGTLPEGYRPPEDIRFTGYNNNASASTSGQAIEECSITTAGVVRWYPFFTSHQCKASVTFIVP